MDDQNRFDVLIIGGSYSGLAAAMALGRALKRVLIIDDEKPCNRQTPQSHNFLTNDGKAPAELAALARMEVSAYDTVRFLNSTAVNGRKTTDGFEIQVASGEIFSATNLVFATGIRDILPAIDGIQACWGISVLHCPFCHGYEVRQKRTGILANGDVAFEFAKLISNWTSDLVLFSNGISSLTKVQKDQLQSKNISIVEKEIASFQHDKGRLQNVLFKDGSGLFVEAVYAPSPFEQHCKIPDALGCELTPEGYIKTDNFQQTTIEGIYAVGDNASKMRTVANAVATGTAAGMAITKKLVFENFEY
jgi:thioredoxin reductase